MTKPKTPLAKSVDLSEFRKLKPATNTCGVVRVAKILVETDTERAEKLKAALMDEDITHTAIEMVLKNWGHQLSSSVISRHRRGLCTCHSATKD